MDGWRDGKGEGGVRTYATKRHFDDARRVRQAEEVCEGRREGLGGSRCGAFRREVLQTSVFFAFWMLVQGRGCPGTYSLAKTPFIAAQPPLAMAYVSHCGLPCLLAEGDDDAVPAAVVVLVPEEDEEGFGRGASGRSSSLSLSSFSPSPSAA